MCQRCRQNREQQALSRRRERIQKQLFSLLVEDHIKGSEYKRLLGIAHSPDKENLVVVEAFINSKLELV